MLSSNSQANKIYSGRRSGSARTLTSTNPLEATKGKLNRWNTGLTKGYAGNQQQGITSAVINSGNGGRKFKKAVLPPVRRRTAKDFA